MFHLHFAVFLHASCERLLCRLVEMNGNGAIRQNYFARFRWFGCGNTGGFLSRSFSGVQRSDVFGCWIAQLTRCRVHKGSHGCAL